MIPYGIYFFLKADVVSKSFYKLLRVNVKNVGSTNLRHAIYIFSEKISRKTDIETLQ